MNKEESQTTTPRSDSKPKRLKPLTRKQAAFIKHLIEKPKDSATKAALATYGTEDKPITYGAAQQVAHDNLSKPNVRLELAKHSQTAEIKLLEVLEESSKRMTNSSDRDGSAWANVLAHTANSVLDRVHGKATIKLEQQSTSVNINIDLTSATTPTE